jgi:hypothetical protein
LRKWIDEQYRMIMLVLMVGELGMIFYLCLKAGR